MEEFIRQFGIDWKLLLAQAVNFGLLLIILTKFAYRPILAMLQKRREDIERGIRMTKEAGEALARSDIAVEEKLTIARADALAIVSRSEETARLRKDEIEAEAVKKSEEIVDAARRAIRQEKAKMNEQVYGEAEGLIRAGIAQVLGKMPAHERDRTLIQEALHELKTVRS